LPEEFFFDCFQKACHEYDASSFDLGAPPQFVIIFSIQISTLCFCERHPQVFLECAMLDECVDIVRCLLRFGGVAWTRRWMYITVVIQNVSSLYGLCVCVCVFFFFFNKGNEHLLL
jgi:hypothetical protein